MFCHANLSTKEAAPFYGLPCGSDGRESARSAGDQGSSPWLGRFAGKENGSPLQDSCLENSMDRGAWWGTICGVAESLI